MERHRWRVSAEFDSLPVLLVFKTVVDEDDFIEAELPITEASAERVAEFLRDTPRPKPPLNHRTTRRSVDRG